MGNTLSSSDESNSKLADKIDDIASKYILSQTFEDMNKMSEKEHCDKMVVLTSKIIDNNLTPLEQKKVVERMYPNNNMEMPQGEMPQGEMPQQLGGNNKQKDCIKIAKFYIKVAHLFSAIMKTINPVITSINTEGKKQKYDLMTKQNMPTDEEILTIEHNNFCTKRINSLLQESDYDRSDLNNISLTIKPRFCNTKNDEENVVSEIGVPELLKLYYDQYDDEEGDYIGMSKNMKSIYETDLDNFHKTFTGKVIPLDEDGNKTITNFDQIPLNDNYEICKENDNLTKTYEGTLKDKLFREYALHIKEMTNQMNKNQDKLLNTLNELFTFKKHRKTKKENMQMPQEDLVGGIKDVDDVTVKLNPDLDDTLLKSLIYSTRKHIVEMYITCENDYLKGITLFEGIVAAQLANTTTSKIRLLTDLIIDYLPNNQMI